MTKIVIVGGVAGGASAAARARRLSETAEIIMLERGPYVSFANCGLPYHIGGDIQQRQSLLLQTPESFRARFNVDVRVQHEVTAIDRERKCVAVRDVINGTTYEESYDRLLLSPGAAPIRPPLPGLDSSRVCTLRNVPDMDGIMHILSSQPIQHVTIVGGGFIGLEMVEALRQRHLAVTVLELSAQVMAPVDIEMATPVHQLLQHQGVDLRLQTGLNAIEEHGTDQPLVLTLSTGVTLTTDLVILAIGVKPETRLAAAAGLQLGTRGGIQVDAQMRTSDPDIFAVGDAVETPDFVTGLASIIPLAGPAKRQGRLAADNMLGRMVPYRRTQGTAICKIFDWAVGCVGLNEKTLVRLQKPYESITVHTASHAGYYPGASPVTLKLLFDPHDGTILGAQALGREGVDKRIDVLAVAQRAGLKVMDLVDLELSYAPPYGSARDVINQAGMVATNVMLGDEQVCHPADIAHRKADQLVLDVRNPGELISIGAFPGAINIPVDQLRQRMHELPKDREILVACQVGLRGHVAARMLKNAGFRVRNLTGGYKTYQQTPV